MTTKTDTEVLQNMLLLLAAASYCTETLTQARNDAIKDGIALLKAHRARASQSPTDPGSAA
jgi:hypothetical protein